MIISGRIAFTIFGVDVYWYGVIMAAAILACVLVAMLLCHFKKINTSYPLEIFLAIVPLGILSARLFSVIFEDGLTIADYFNFRTGGLSIMGAIIGGAIGALCYVLIFKRNLLASLDIITTVLLLGQSIGRWGNYFNNELYGKEITSSAWQFFPFAVNIGGTWYQALFFYESMLSLLGFVILLIIYLKTNKPGLCTGLYLIYYGVVRLCLEGLRQSEYILKWGNVQVSSLVGGLLVAAGVAILAIVIIKEVRAKKEQVNG